MANIQSIKSLSTADLLASKSGNTVEGSSTDFAQELKNALGNVNQMQVDGEKAMKCRIKNYLF
jgi:flagellar hook-basal body complex protein FliE